MSEDTIRLMRNLDNGRARLLKSQTPCVPEKDLRAEHAELIQRGGQIVQELCTYQYEHKPVDTLQKGERALVWREMRDAFVWMEALE